MDGDGFATKLVVDDEGKVRNEYVEDDGSISVGDYDMVPLIDRFVEKHPDFSYRGAKGIVALLVTVRIRAMKQDPMTLIRTRSTGLTAIRISALRKNGKVPKRSPTP